MLGPQPETRTLEPWASACAHVHTSLQCDNSMDSQNASDLATVGQQDARVREAREEMGVQ